jgi:hypothetical protein
MKQELENINKIYLQIQDYFFPAPEYFDDKPDGQEYIKKGQEYEPLHSFAKGEFLRISPLLAPEEIIEGYEQGCRLLQANLSGLMYNKFDRKYIPIMLKAIKDDHSHTAFLFLRALVLYAKDQKDKLVPLILSSLRSKYVVTLEAALSAAFELRLIEAIPIVEQMTKDSRPEIREMAERFLSDWENDRPK